MHGGYRGRRALSWKLRRWKQLRLWRCNNHMSDEQPLWQCTRSRSWFTKPSSPLLAQSSNGGVYVTTRKKNAGLATDRSCYLSPIIANRPTLNVSRDSLPVYAVSNSNLLQVMRRSNKSRKVSTDRFLENMHIPILSVIGPQCQTTTRSTTISPSPPGGRAISPQLRLRTYPSRCI